MSHACRVKIHALYIAFSSVILQKPKASKGTKQTAKSGVKKAPQRGQGAKGRGHGKSSAAKTGPTTTRVHASAAVTGIAVPLGQGVPRTRARAAEKLPSSYEL